MRINFLLIIFLFVHLSIFGQVDIEKEIKSFSCSCENQNAVREYFEQYENHLRFIARTERESDQRRKSPNLPKPIKVSGFGPSAVSLVKPFYPRFAKQQKIFGEVLVKVFTDEKGLVIYSKILKGNTFLRESVRKAACLSRFTPILFGEKLVKWRWIIKYRFVTN